MSSDCSPSPLQALHRICNSPTQTCSCESETSFVTIILLRGKSGISWPNSGLELLDLEDALDFAALPECASAKSTRELLLAFWRLGLDLSEMALRILRRIFSGVFFASKIEREGRLTATSDIPPSSIARKLACVRSPMKRCVSNS